MIGLVVDNDWSEWWTIYPHPKDSRYLVVEARQQRDFLLWGKKISYSELGVRGFSEVLLELILNTNKYMEKFAGKGFNIGNIVIDGDGIEINGFGLTEFSYNMPKFISGDGEHVELAIFKFDDRFEVLMTEFNKLNGYLFKIRKSPDSNKLEVESLDGTKREIESGDGNICELFRKILLSPRPAIEEITGKKVFIMGIMIEDLSRVNKMGFGDCNVVNDFDIPFIEKVLGKYDRMFDENLNNLMYKEWALVLEKYGDKKFMFYLKDDPEKRAWVVEPHHIDNTLFVLSFMRDGYEIVSMVRKYYDYGSANINDVLKKILEKPQIMLGALTNVSARIGRVEIIEKNEKDEDNKGSGLKNLNIGQLIYTAG